MATNYYNAQIGVVDASGNVNVIYPITKAANVDLVATSYSTVEACLAALGTAAFKNASDTYTATGSTVATTKAVYDAYSTLNSNKQAKGSYASSDHGHNSWSYQPFTLTKGAGNTSNTTIYGYYNSDLFLLVLDVNVTFHTNNPMSGSTTGIYSEYSFAKNKLGLLGSSRSPSYKFNFIVGDYVDVVPYLQVTISTTATISLQSMKTNLAKNTDYVMNEFIILPCYVS